MSLVLQSADMGRGVSWLTEALPYFTRNPLGWIAAMVVIFLLSIALSMIPVLGSLITNLFYPVIGGGFMLGCAAHQQGDSFEFQHAFAGFKEPYFKRLTVLGLINMLATIAIFVLVAIMAFVMLGGFEFFQQLQQAQPEDISNYGMDMLLLTLIALALFTPLIMAMWFAPVLIISSDKTPIEAMIMSFNACLKNILPFLLYGVIIFIVSILAAIPLFLGFLVLLPVLSASVYVAFQDCFRLDISDEPTQLMT